MAEDRGVAGMAPRRGEDAAWRGKERGWLDAGGATGMGIESRLVGHGHWRGISRGRPDAIR